MFVDLETVVVPTGDRGMDVSDYSVVENMTEALWQSLALVFCQRCLILCSKPLQFRLRGSIFPTPDATSSAFKSAQFVKLLKAFEPYYKLWTSAIDFKHSEASGFVWIPESCTRCICICIHTVYIYILHVFTYELYIDIFIEGSLEVKLPTIWTDEKQSREEAERRERLEERRVEEKE